MMPCARSRLHTECHHRAEQRDRADRGLRIPPALRDQRLEVGA
jgi:hypothetical protein